MVCKYIIFTSLLAAANAGLAAYSVSAPAYSAYVASPYAAIYDPAVASTHTSTYRGLGGLSSITQYANAQDSAYTSVRNADIRVTNDAVAYAPAAVAPYTALAAVRAAPFGALAAPFAAYRAPLTVAAAPAAVAYSGAPVVAL